MTGKPQKCPGCGKMNPASYKRCAYCRQPLAPVRVEDVTPKNAGDQFPYGI